MIILKRALITGASSGIGKVFSYELAKRGYETVLVARRLERLQTISDQIERDLGVRSIPLKGDLTNENDLVEVSKLLKDVDLLINNAGFGLIGPFEDIEADREMQMIKLNIGALYFLTKKYALMRNSIGGEIINVASTAAYLPVPGMAVYAATKAFVLSFSEAVSEELQPKGFKVMVLSPGPTRTEFFDVASGGRRQLPGSMSPEEVVKRALDAFEKGKRSVVSGLINKIIASGSRLVPRAIALKAARRAFED
ncbi:SDR family NAD(P)-dependent oxidoreductase [Mesotoga sp. UBA6090]|uniref:SDR family NAD(P)-dependent oxidoreductase n=1 Tax=Mesotoga sp. UBA6090 TaxID=1946860 RepID=UPI0025F88C69|nr:SDR family oxidoreductase [Mesotoga sp. UBA6090]